MNLANSVVAGDRGSALDKVLFNHILSNGKSLEEISNTINSITAMGAVAGLTAMTVDFSAYVTEQVEHHASTMPRQAEGWWVQPIAGKLKSDDLAVGGMKGGYSIDTVGIMGGFDKKLRNGDTIGVAASYQSGDADSEGEGLPVTTDVTNYGLHLWHARQFDAYRLMGMFSYSKTSGDAKMNYVGNEITSDLGATEISIGARADKEFQWGTVRMIPHAGVRASMIDVDDYTIEMGSEELFKVSEDKLWIFEVPVGVTFASPFEYARWNVQPYVDLTVRGRFGDTDSTFTLEGSNTSDSMKYDVTGDVIGDLRIDYMSTFQDLNLGGRRRPPESSDRSDAAHRLQLSLSSPDVLRGRRNASRKSGDRFGPVPVFSFRRCGYSFRPEFQAFFCPPEECSTAALSMAAPSDAHLRHAVSPAAIRFRTPRR